METFFQIKSSERLRFQVPTDLDNLCFSKCCKNGVVTFFRSKCWFPKYRVCKSHYLCEV